MTFTKRDLAFAAITGFTTGFIAWRVVEYLEKADSIPFSFMWLMAIIPLLWIFGVNFGFFLGRWMPFFNQFGKFAAIGFTNFAVDIGTFNLLFSLSHENKDWFVLFKVISFIIASTHSYFWNKYWSFNAGSSGGGGVEFLKFLSVSGLALLVNVSVASIFAHSLVAPDGITDKVWINLGLIAGSASALIFSFVGFRLVVFRK